MAESDSFSNPITHLDDVISAVNQAAREKAHDLEAVWGPLEHWLSEKTGAAVSIANLRLPQGAGTSSETLLCDANWEDERNATVTEHLVFRVHPTGAFQIFLDPEFELQFKAIEALHRHGNVRVPKPWAYESSTAIFGQPFFVMEQLIGRVPVSNPPYNLEGWLADASASQRHRAWKSAVEQLCRIARVPPERVGFLSRAEPRQSELQQQMDYWQRMLMWITDNQPPAVFLALLEWLITNFPRQIQSGLAWGDARIGNMIFGPDFKVLAVLDWEQVNLGGPMQDLGWWLFMDHLQSDARGIRRLDGLGGRAETIALWEDLVGEPADDLAWYEVFAATKVAMLAIRTRAILRDPKALDPSKNVSLRIACELSGVLPR